VAFSGTSAGYTVNSATSITATMPAGATTGTISVTTPGGTATSADDFTVGVYAPGLSFYTVAPCRVLDTRNPDGPLGGPVLTAGTARTFTIAGSCNIPATATAVSANVTVTQPSGAGNVRVYPADIPMPNVSTINYSAGQTRANSAIIPLNAFGEMTVVAKPSGTVHFILDVNGYFE